MTTVLRDSLTRTQKRVLDALTRYYQEHGFPASTRVLGNLLGRREGTIHPHLVRLHEMGLLRKEGEKGMYLPADAGRVGDDAY